MEPIVIGPPDHVDGIAECSRGRVMPRHGSGALAHRAVNVQLYAEHPFSCILGGSRTSHTDARQRQYDGETATS